MAYPPKRPLSPLFIVNQGAPVLFWNEIVPILDTQCDLEQVRPVSFEGIVNLPFLKSEIPSMKKHRGGQRKFGRRGKVNDGGKKLRMKIV
jgi:hypothetical protein